MDSNKEFVWTDELVLEFLNEHYKTQGAFNPHFFKSNLEYFKNFKKPKPEWEIVSFIGNYLGHSNVTFKLTPEDDYMAIQTLITTRYPLSRLLNEKNVSIHSVRRLSDGEVFSVGDEIYDKGFPMIQTGDETRKEICPISSFNIAEAYCKKYMSVTVQVKSNYFSSFSLQDAVKAPPKPKPLFVTEDGVEVTDVKTTVYAICPKGTWEDKWGSADGVSTLGRNWLIFSSREKRDEYILMNKPLLSINDVERNGVLLYGHEDYEQMVNFNQLKELAKQKLNNTK